MIVLCLLLLSSSIVDASPNDRKLKFSVIRTQTRTLEELDAIRSLLHDTAMDFWLSPKAIGDTADIMVDEESVVELDAILAEHNMTRKVMIDDVESLIVQKERSPNHRIANFSKRLHNEGGNRARFGFGEYHSYSTITDWLNEIQQKYPDRAKVFSIGTTHEGRGIYGIKIGSNLAAPNRRAFWIDGGIHAREWAAVHTALYFIDRLIADAEDDPIIRMAMSRLNFYVIPVANPDGYEYSRSDVSPMIRLWRKNRAGVVCKKDRWFRDRCCGGVDLNRNFDWYFGEAGSSTDKCSEIYQGSGMFSEAESRAIRDMINSNELKDKVDGFISLHTYSQMWIHPFSHKRHSVPADINDIERVGKAAVAALENTYGTKYKFGTGSDILYPSSGGSDDWAKGRVGIKYVYLLELRPGEDMWDGFILDQRQLIPTAKETWNGIKVVIRAVAEFAQRRGEDDDGVSDLSTTTTATTTTPTHLSASYRLGKRRFNFVSIRTFRPTIAFSPPAATTTTTTLSPASSGLEEESNVMIEGNGAAAITPSSHQMAAFVRRPASSSSRFTSSSSSSRLVLQRNRSSVVRKPSTVSESFRTRPSTSLIVTPNVTQNKTPSSSTLCIDRSAWCSAWLATNRNVCKVSSIYMRQECARTCAFCRR